MISAKQVALFGYGGSTGYFPAVWFAEADESHLSPEEKARYEQGIAPGWLALEQKVNCTATPSSFGALAGTGRVSVEGHHLTECSVRGYGARSGTGSANAVTSSVVSARGYGAYATSFRTTVEGSASVVAAGWGVRARMGRVYPAGDGEVNAGSACAFARSRVSLQCDTVKNPTDEEIILWFLTHRA